MGADYRDEEVVTDLEYNLRKLLFCNFGMVYVIVCVHLDS